MQMSRDWTGMESDATSRMIQNEMEYWVEDLIGAKQINEGKLEMYKGTLKKW